MKKGTRLLGFGVAVLMAASVFAGCSTKTEPASSPGTGTGTEKKAEPVTLNLAIAGDTNMVELYKAIAPEFTKKYPNITLNPVGTGPGDPGSNAIFTKLDAQNKAGTAKWDLDVAIIHQSIMGPMIENKLLQSYVGGLQNKAMVVGDGAKNALGTNVDGYVVPMFQSQIALAYTEQVKEAPKNFEELVTWIKANPNKFGYNGVKGGMSGVGFTTSWLYWKTGEYNLLAKGPYDEKKSSGWSAAMKELKALPTVVTNGNAGTLDMLNRSEIYMGPVWVDMYYTWMREGRMNPKVRLKLIEPGMTGQPMYFVIPAKAANSEAARLFIDFMATPEIQAKYIVERNGWYPGVDAAKVMPLVSQEAKDKLFKDISPEDLAKRGQAFPLAPFLKDVLTAYETN
ncbi:MAG TPA: extracellular solute-binding protein [Symbiobacteriaceae bacterium]|nr:extracellular solute-binding protein [Symbiobacteriaceae bacterium]